LIDEIDNKNIENNTGMNIQVSGKLVTQLLLFSNIKAWGCQLSFAYRIWKLLLCVDSLGSCMKGSAHAGAPTAEFTAEFSACLQL